MLTKCGMHGPPAAGKMCQQNVAWCMPPLQARLPGMVAEELQQVHLWRQQNEQDQRADMEELEGLMLDAVGGLQGLQRQLAEQNVVSNGVAVQLQQVADWLRVQMHASCSRITAYLHVTQRGNE